MILRLLASLLLVVTSLGVGPAIAAAQDSDEPTSAVVDESVEDDDSTENAATEDASNLSALLVGAVLLGAGVWAYMNKKKRFPGAQFRD